VDALYNLARVHDGCWRRWFATHGIEPYPVVYEELALDPERAAGRALDFLGLEPAAPLAAPAELTRQADAVDEEWARLYRERAGL
jgi:LPS sulfotransferase NodH